MKKEKDTKPSDTDSKFPLLALSLFYTQINDFITRIPFGMQPRLPGVCPFLFFRFGLAPLKKRRKV